MSLEILNSNSKQEDRIYLKDGTWKASPKYLTVRAAGKHKSNNSGNHTHKMIKLELVDHSG